MYAVYYCIWNNRHANVYNTGSTLKSLEAICTPSTRNPCNKSMAYQALTWCNIASMLLHFHKCFKESEKWLPNTSPVHAYCIQAYCFRVWSVKNDCTQPIQSGNLKLSLSRWWVGPRTYQQRPHHSSFHQMSECCRCRKGHLFILDVVVWRGKVTWRKLSL